MLVLTKLAGVTACTVGFVRGVFPCNDFVVRRVAGVACPKRMRLVADADVAVSVSGRPNCCAVTRVTTTRRDEMALIFGLSIDRRVRATVTGCAVSRSNRSGRSGVAHYCRLERREILVTGVALGSRGNMRCRLEHT